MVSLKSHPFCEFSGPSVRAQFVDSAFTRCPDLWNVTCSPLRAVPSPCLATVCNWKKWFWMNAQLSERSSQIMWIHHVELQTTHVCSSGSSNHPGALAQVASFVLDFEWIWPNGCLTIWVMNTKIDAGLAWMANISKTYRTWCCWGRLMSNQGEHLLKQNTHVHSCLYAKVYTLIFVYTRSTLHTWVI